MPEESKRRSRFDSAAIMAAKAAGRAAAGEMGRQLAPVHESIEQVKDALGEIARRLDDESTGPTITLDELTKIAREEMQKVPSSSTESPAEKSTSAAVHQTVAE